MGLVKAKVQSMKDQTLSSCGCIYDLIEGEIFECVFKNEANLKAFIDMKIVKLVPADTKICKNIPVVLLKKELPILPVNVVKEKKEVVILKETPVVEIKKPIIAVKEIIPVVPEVLLPKVDYSEVLIPVLLDDSGNELPLSSFLIQGNK